MNIQDVLREARFFGVHQLVAALEAQVRSLHAELALFSHEKLQIEDTKTKLKQMATTEKVPILLSNYLRVYVWWLLHGLELDIDLIVVV